MQRIATRMLGGTLPWLAAAVLVVMPVSPSAQPDADSLAAGFKAPPDAARPRTWWHWTMGNVTKDGITKDLEWMKRAGIGGFMLADVKAGGGQAVEEKIRDTGAT